MEINDELLNFWIFMEIEDEVEEDIVLLAKHHEKPKRKDHHKMFKERNTAGCFKITIQNYLMEDEGNFRKFFRLTPNLFHTLLNEIRADITKAPTLRVPNPLSPEIKLCLILRFLATGESQRSLGLQYRISDSYVAQILKEVFNSIIKRKLEVDLKEPTQEEWREKASEFYKKWNFPMCVGAIDGTHVRIVCPINSGSLYHNYKDFFSTVLLAIVDANYKFIAIDVGSYGREGDSGILKKSNIGKRLRNNTFNMPGPSSIPNTNVEVNHVLLGDAAFPLAHYMMKPYSRKSALIEKEKNIFNYRLSRARRVVENAFGIMAQYFRIFLTPINMRSDTINKAIITSIILHNILRTNNIQSEPLTSEEQQQTNSNSCFRAMAQNRGRPDGEAKLIREKFKDYFVSEAGTVNWQ